MASFIGAMVPPLLPPSSHMPLLDESGGSQTGVVTVETPTATMSAQARPFLLKLFMKWGFPL